MKIFKTQNNEAISEFDNDFYENYNCSSGLRIKRFAENTFGSIYPKMPNRDDSYNPNGKKSVRHSN